MLLFCRHRDTRQLLEVQILSSLVCVQWNGVCTLLLFKNMFTSYQLAVHLILSVKNCDGCFWLYRSNPTECCKALVLLLKSVALLWVFILNQVSLHKQGIWLGKVTLSVLTQNIQHNTIQYNTIQYKQTNSATVQWTKEFKKVCTRRNGYIQ